MKCLWLENSTCPPDLVYSMNLQQAKLVWPVIVFMIGLFLLGIIGNSLVIVVYATKTNASSANISILGLAVVDILSCILIHPYVISQLFRRFDQDGIAACKIFQFFVHASLSVSICMLVLIAYDRYLAICKPLQVNRGVFSLRNMLIACIVIGVAPNIPILEYFTVKVTMIKFENKEFETKACEFSDKYLGLVFSIYGVLSLCAFLTCFISITVFYCKLARAVRRSKRIYPTDIPNLGRPHAPEIAPPSASLSYKVNPCDKPMCEKKTDIFTIPKTTGGSRIRIPKLNPIQTSTLLNRPASTKTAKILFMVTVVFLLSWIPYWIIKIAIVVNPTFWKEKSDYDFLLERFLNHLFYINNAVNPLIYTGMNRRFRNELKRTWKDIRRKFQ